MNGVELLLGCVYCCLICFEFSLSLLSFFGFHDHEHNKYIWCVMTTFVKQAHLRLKLSLDSCDGCHL